MSLDVSHDISHYLSHYMSHYMSHHITSHTLHTQMYPDMRVCVYTYINVCVCMIMYVYTKLSVHIHSSYDCCHPAERKSYWTAADPISNGYNNIVPCDFSLKPTQ